MQLSRYNPQAPAQNGEYIPRYAPNNQQQPSGFLIAIERIFYVFGFGMACIVLNAVYHSWHSLQADFDILIFRAFIVGVLFALALLAGFLYLIFEQKHNAKVSGLSSQYDIEAAEQNDPAQESMDDFFIMPRFLKEGTLEFNEAVIDRFNYLHSVGRYSKSRLSMDVFKKKGNFYEKKLADILAAAGEEL